MIGYIQRNFFLFESSRCVNSRIYSVAFKVPALFTDVSLLNFNGLRLLVMFIFNKAGLFLDSDLFAVSWR
jgi:hypothetical protein